MAIYTRNKEGDLSPLNIPAIKGKDGITPKIKVGEVTTLPAGEKAKVEMCGDVENPVLNFGIPKGRDGDGAGCEIDDNTISEDKGWSSSKTEDFVLTNVGAIWSEVNGGQMVIDNTMDGFLREVEILGNTIQNQDNLSDIQHLGVWNAGKQGYDIEITVSNSSNKEDSNYQEFRTTITLPCQLMKVGDFSDKLYWDKNRRRYIIDKKISKTIIKASDKSLDLYPTDDSKKTIRFRQYPMSNPNDILRVNPFHVAICNKLKCKIRDDKKDEEYINISFPTPNYTQILFSVNKDKFNSTNFNDITEWYRDNPMDLYYILKTPQIIETNIYEEIKLPTYMKVTYVSVSGGIQGYIKAKAPVDGGKVIGNLQDETNQNIENLNVDIISTTFDTEYKLLEMKWLLEDAGIITSQDLLLNDNKSLNETLSLTRYEQAKILILSNKYNKERMTYQLTKYYERKCLEEDEFNELIELMNNNNNL